VDGPCAGRPGTMNIFKKKKTAINDSLFLFLGRFRPDLSKPYNLLKQVSAGKNILFGGVTMQVKL
jgi:hypothetical protein